MNMFITEMYKDAWNKFARFKAVTNIARAMPDKLASKMVLEQGQILSTAHRKCDEVDNGREVDHRLYKIAHVNHPVCIWARGSTGNYRFSYLLFVALGREFYYRRGKHHKTFLDLHEPLKKPPYHLPNGGFTEPPQCMPDEYKHKNYARAYRNYIMYDKDYLSWDWGRRPPMWYLDSIMV